jgi:capsular polysaccharide biosynthesis protein
VNDQDQMITWPRGNGRLPDRMWNGNTPADEERPAADLTGGLANLGFISAALGRKRRVWCVTAVLGLMIGTGLYVKFPPAYHATTTIMLAYNPGVNPEVEAANEAQMAESAPVAGRVVQELKLPQTVASFQASYTVTVVTDNVLTINVGARSTKGALERASALATAFLQYRASYALAEEQQQAAQLDQQYNAARQELQSLQKQVAQLPTPLPAGDKAAYEHLETQITAQDEILTYVTTTNLATKTNTNNIVTDSYILDPATPVKRSRIKDPGLYFAGGLVGGLMVGVGGVLISALTSRRLRRRDDVAAALGAPVRLSVGRVRPRRLPLNLPGRAAKRELNMKRVVLYLRGVLPGSSRGPVSLAVVAVDDVPVAAQAFVSLATSCAAEGKQVVVADLSAGAQLARLLGVHDPGIHEVRQNGANLVLFRPQPEDIAPVGPVPGEAFPAVPAQAAPALVTACSAADLLLTFATLDPAVGGDHLRTWATNAVAVVTAGDSTAEKVHAVGEMIRLAGTRLDSVVLLGADENDESLGTTGLADQSILIDPV